jgi:undecaprenyl-diphosphatase
MVMLVALSRMYLGVHYLSDVLAAAAEGAAWLAICITAVSTLHRRRLARGERSWSEHAHAAEDLR